MKKLFKIIVLSCCVSLMTFHVRAENNGGDKKDEQLDNVTKGVLLANFLAALLSNKDTSGSGTGGKNCVSEKNQRCGYYEKNGHTMTDSHLSPCCEPMTCYITSVSSTQVNGDTSSESSGYCAMKKTQS